MADVPAGVLDDMAATSNSRGDQGSSMLYIEGLEPGSGAFGAALAAAERASVNAPRRVSQSLSQVNFGNSPCFPAKSAAAFHSRSVWRWCHAAQASTLYVGMFVKGPGDQLRANRQSYVHADLPNQHIAPNTNISHGESKKMLSRVTVLEVTVLEHWQPKFCP